MRGRIKTSQFDDRISPSSKRSGDKKQESALNKQKNPQKKNTNKTSKKPWVFNLQFLIRHGKRAVFLGCGLYAFILLSMILICLSDIQTKGDFVKKQVYLSVKQDFFNLSNRFNTIQHAVYNTVGTTDRLKAQNDKLNEELKKLLVEYPFIDVAYNVEYFPREKIKNKKTHIHNFEINPYQDINSVYNKYLNNVFEEVRAILANHEIKDSGFFYYDILHKESAYYVMHLKNNHYAFIRLSHKSFSEFYTENDIIPSFRFENFGDGVKKYPFEFIKNIYSIHLENSNALVFYSNIIAVYSVFFLILHIAAYWGYCGLLSHYKNVQKLRKAEKDLTVINSNKSSSETRMQHLIEATDFVPWMADPESNVFTYIGCQITDITGIPYESWTSKGYFLAHIHQDDRDIFFKAIKRLNMEPRVSVEYRIYSNTGNIIWLKNTISKTYLKNATNNKDTAILQGFIIDITSQKRILDTLETAKLVAEKASQMKSNFLASMSHELRTPLNSIIGFADIINSLSKDNEMIAEYSGNILTSGKHLLDLINDILDYSKIEAGEFEIRREPTSVSEIFDSCKVLISTRAESMNISLVIKYPTQDYYLNIDPLRIKQVLINLMTNALKFNRPNGKISLTCDIQEGSDVIIKVTDTGIGMKPEDLKVALEKFRQVDDKRSRQQEGTGLGLSISKSLIELHDGKLSLDSIYGKGTQVKITLPASIIYNQVEDDNNDDLADSA